MYGGTSNKREIEKVGKRELQRRKLAIYLKDAQQIRERLTVIRTSLSILIGRDSEAATVLRDAADLIAQLAHELEPKTKG